MPLLGMRSREGLAREFRVALANYKIIFRVDYKPTLGFFSKMFSIASGVQGYPDWRSDGLSITLQNLEVWCSFHLGPNLFTYVREVKKEEAPGGDDKRIRAILENVTPKLEKGAYSRVGLRCWFLYPVTMSFENLVSLVS